MVQPKRYYSIINSKLSYISIHIYKLFYYKRYKLNIFLKDILSLL
jgi:hypothetical protein